MAVDPPLVAPCFGADGFEDSLVLDGEAWGKGLFGLFAAAVRGDEDVVFGVLRGGCVLVFSFLCPHACYISLFFFWFFFSSGSKRKIALMRRR